MAFTIRCDIAPAHIAFAESVGEWVRAFYPDVSVSFDGDSATLASEVRSVDELRLIWLSALANEKLLAQGVRHRAAVLDALVG